jgi:hypothetical protein
MGNSEFENWMPPTAEAIREEDNYSGVRVTLSEMLSRAIIRLHVDGKALEMSQLEPRKRFLQRRIQEVKE